MTELSDWKEKNGRLACPGCGSSDVIETEVFSELDTLQDGNKIVSFGCGLCGKQGPTVRMVKTSAMIF